MAIAALHPVAAARPDEIRWVSAWTPGRGRVIGAPPALAELIEDGTLISVVSTDDAVLTRIADVGQWKTVGARVRSALSVALADHDGWILAELTGGAGDALIGRVVGELLDGEVGEYAQSHGGAIELVEVSHGVVHVRLHGACRGCAASEISLRVRLERAIRDRCPDFVRVTAA